jgi:hypothetical protein
MIQSTIILSEPFIEEFLKYEFNEDFIETVNKT